MKNQWKQQLGPALKRGAELVTIVMGVLIALGVDAARQAWTDRSRETVYLESLLADLEGDSVTLSNALGQNQWRSDEARRAMGYALGNGIDPGGLPTSVRGVPLPAPDSTTRAVIAMMNAGYAEFPVFATTTYRDLVGTGNLRLLGDDAVRQGLSDYYRSIDEAAQWDEVVRDQVWGSYQQQYRRVISPRLHVRLYDDLEEVTRAGIGPDEVARMRNSLTELEELSSALAGVVTALRTQRFRLSATNREGAALRERLRGVLRFRP